MVVRGVPVFARVEGVRVFVVNRDGSGVLLSARRRRVWRLPVSENSVERRCCDGYCVFLLVLDLGGC